MKIVTIKQYGIKFCNHWKKQSKSDISYISLWDKVIQPVVQCDVPTVKNTSLDDDDNVDHDGCK